MVERFDWLGGANATGSVEPPQEFFAFGIDGKDRIASRLLVLQMPRDKVKLLLTIR